MRFVFQFFKKLCNCFGVILFGLSSDLLWWKRNDYKNYEIVVRKSLWNKENNKDNFVKDDFTSQIISDRDSFVELRKFIAESRENKIDKCSYINNILIIIWTGGMALSQETLVVHFWVVSLFYIGSVGINLNYFSSILSYVHYNTAVTMIIREYEKMLPSKPHGTAIPEALYDKKSPKYSAVFNSELSTPRMFIFIYTGLYIYFLVQISIS